MSIENLKHRVEKLELLEPTPPSELKPRMQAYERRLLQEGLDFYQWNCKKAAESFKISYRSLMLKIKQHQLLRP